MIIDSSALIAIIRSEPDAARYAEAVARAASIRLSAATYVETAIVVDGPRNPVVSRRFDDFLTRTGMEIAPVTPEQARLARAAYRDFGRGSGHPAALNFGDCFSYALAKENDEPLLFKGSDFLHTDIISAAPGPESP